MSSTIANHGPEIPVNFPSIVIEENSIVMKAISCIPLLGMIPSLIQELSLARKIQDAEDTPRLIELINVKNQYKVANAIRNLLSAALIIAGVAFGILGGTAVSAFMLAGVLTVVAGLNIYRMHKNNRLITELQSTGFRPGMRFF